MHGHFIADILKRNNISQNELARRMGLDPATINRFAKNKIRLSAMFLIKLHQSDIKYNKEMYFNIVKEITQ